MKQTLSNRDGGFTLVELLVVMVVLALLAAIAIPQFLENRERAYRSATETDLRNMALLFHATAQDNGGQFPTALPAGVATSSDVTLALGAAASTSRICLTADHAGLVSILYYDSSAGGLTTVAC